mmetsp:Transcript_15090/g.19787  ORF Transcript_15090/g.19787 Transcript_15090/m.19787 type:complete len:1061 (-) Transcript_15090:269-3451(-)
MPRKRSSLTDTFKNAAKIALDAKNSKTEQNATLASYYVQDSWAGRLENGLGKNSKKSPSVFRAFKIQTSTQWTNMNLVAIFLHSAIALCDSSVFTKTLSLCCIVIFGFDILLKMTYMGVETYFSKQWQYLYTIIVVLLLMETLTSLFISHRLYAAYCFRPVLLCLRERSIRRFFTVVKDMGPGFLEVCFPLVFFLIFVSAFATIWFKVDLPEQFSSVGVALYNYWMLISTGDTYTQLLPPSMKNAAVYMTTFFVILIVGNLFLLSMLMGVTFEVFLEHTKGQVKKERLKELKGLLKAFTILDEDQTGTIDSKTFKLFLARLKPGLSDQEHMLYYELATNGDVDLNAIDFLDLKKVLSYKFVFEEDAHKLVKTPSMRDSRIRTLYIELFIMIQEIVSSSWYKRCITVIAIVDFLLLFLTHYSWIESMAFCTFLAAVIDFSLRVAACGTNYFKQASGHERVAMLAVAFEIILWIDWVAWFPVMAVWFPTLLSLTPGNVGLAYQLARLGRCWRLVQLNENLKQYFGCFFGLLPVLFQTISFALIIAYFFAMLGMQAYGGKVHYFHNPKAAVLTMVQIFFGVDVGTVIEESTQQGHRGLGIIFFVSYFVVGVIIAFNLINTIIIQFYGETMDDSSQKHIQEEKKADEKLQVELFERVMKKTVLTTMSGMHRGLLPRLRVSRVNLHLSGANMRRRLTGNTTMAITTEELKKIQQYAKKFKYEVDLLKIYTDRVEGASGAKDFEKKLYYELRDNKATVEQKFKDGEYIIRMGDIDHKCYFVHEGNINLFYNNERVKSLHKGQMFGEDMLLSGLPHAFDCIAIGDVTVLYFDRKTFLNDFNTDMQGQFANKAIRSVMDAEEVARRVSSHQFVRTFSQNLMSKSIKFQGSRSLSLKQCTPKNGGKKHPVSFNENVSSASDQVRNQNSCPLEKGKSSSLEFDVDSDKEVGENITGFGSTENEDLPPLQQIEEDDVMELEFHPNYWSVADDIAQQYVASQILEASIRRNSHRFGLQNDDIGDLEVSQTQSNGLLTPLAIQRMKVPNSAVVTPSDDENSPPTLQGKDGQSP